MAGTSAERPRVIYALLAVLYVGLTANFYLTVRLWGTVGSFSGSKFGPDDDGVPLGDLKRSKRQYPDDAAGDKVVEFFPQPQPTHETDGYVWLTSYSRIPVEVLQEFCFTTKLHCPAAESGPPGTPGTPGYKGEKGDRGDRGMPGEMGPRGTQGFMGIPGPVGPKGEHGIPGMIGLDGRDGIPGEPGLDGVPGRDGVDGIPGRDGIPGIPGTPGRFGTNGTNGIPGSPGPRGPAGAPGPPGLPGPRGRKGTSGKAGTPGIPGIKAWTVNGTDMKANTLLIPPSIIDVESQTSLIVDEGHKVKLECSATGQPTPSYLWRSDENKPIRLRSWQQSSVNSNVLEIQQVSREHMGLYVCIASNGIPPPAIKKTKLEVAFPPLIKIRNQMVGTVNGSFALLECFVEAHPPAVNFWMHGDNRLLEPSWKYKIDNRDDSYRTHMILNISYIETLDYGLYKCVSKNDKGKTLGVFTVFEIDPHTPTRKPPVETFEVYGQPPPTIMVEQPECEPCLTKCEPTPFCPTSGTIDLSRVQSVSVVNSSNMVHPLPRKDNCMIHQLGKPVFQRSSKEETGSWWQDPYPSDATDNKYYATFASDTSHLYEYTSRELFRSDNRSVFYELPYPFSGTGHIIYNGTFFYHQANKFTVVGFDFSGEPRNKGKDIPDASYSDGHYLYNSELGYMDLMADENGLWLVYAAKYTNNTLIRKLHPYTLETEYMWNLTLPHRMFGDMFIACGVLYAVDSVTEASTRIRFAFDLYQNKVLEVNIPFSNPFKNNSMIAYNPKHRKIFAWDRGNQLIYPILFGTIDIGQPEQKNERK